MGPTGLLLLSILVCLAIPLVLLGWLGALRVPWAQQTPGALEKARLSTDHYPDHMQQVANSFRNQFELPVLFYVVAAIMLFVGVDWLFSGTACLFVVARIWHAIEHSGRNRVLIRFNIYTAGYALLILLWALAAVKVTTNVGALS